MCSNSIMSGDQIAQMLALKTNSDRVDFFLRNVDFDFKAEKPRKNDDFAKKFRDLAKEYLSESQYESAAYYFTRSLAFAESQKSIALSYGCRPSASMKMELYQEAILDIHRALKTGSREDVQTKLLAGLNLCEKRAQPCKEGPPTIPDCEKHPFIQCARNCINIERNEQFGKHIIASREIEIGEILAVDVPFSVTVTQDLYKYCSECGKGSHSLIPCDYCVETMYCSDSCKDKAEACHKYECLVQHFYSMGILNRAVKKTLKTTLQSFVEHPSDELKSNEYRSDRYREVSELSTSLDKMEDERLYLAVQTASVAFLSIKYHTTFFIDFNNLSDVEDLFKERLVHNFGIRNINDANLGFAPVNISAIYSLFSLFNHSCIPNAEFTSHDNKMILRAVRSIKKGEQCFINYINTWYWESTAIDRQNMLSKYYCFKCSCRACLEDWKIPRLVLNQEYRNATKALQRVDMEFTKNFLTKLYGQIKELETREPCPELVYVDDLVAKCFHLLAGKGYVSSNVDSRLAGLI